MRTCNRTIQTLAIGALAGAAALISAPTALASPGCPADMAPLPNGDLTVNVSDLLAVIAAWGNCANPNNCPADVAPLPSGDDTVNVSDLLAVIAAWGACPPPPGPVNNECAGATTLVNGANPFDNTGATQSLPLPASSTPECILGGPVNMTRDVWFTYTATCTGTVRFDACATLSPFVDTVMVAYDACGGNQIACDDDACPATTPETFRSSITLACTSGQSFKLRVGSWANAATNQGPGVITVTCVAADNDFCFDATSIAIGGSVNGNVFNATPEANGPPACNGGPRPGRWHKVVGNGNILTASTCGSPGELWDSVLAVYCGIGCDDLNCVSTISNPSCGPFGLNESVTWCSAVGQTYHILVAYDQQPQPGEGNYNLTVTSGAACANPIVCFTPPPANDECEGAVTVNLGPNNLNNDDATKSTDAGLECTGGGSPSATRDIWAKWTATCSGGAIFDTCATPGAVNDTIVGVYSGTCANLTEIGCDEDSCVVPPAINDFNSSVAVSVTLGQQYFIRIASFTGSPDGNIVLTIACDSSVVCGNGILQPGEECDDGNAVPNDGCTNCTVDTPVFPCVGSPEGLPCFVDGSTPGLDANGGCNSTPIAFTTPITLGQTKCGTISTYLNNATPAVCTRDTDWYHFTAPTTGNYQVVMFCPSFPGQLGVVTNTAGNITSCGAGVAFVAPGGFVTGTTGLVVINRVLTAGNTYAVHCTKWANGGTCIPAVDCANGAYSVRITYMPTP